MGKDVTSGSGDSPDLPATRAPRSSGARGVGRRGFIGALGAASGLLGVGALTATRRSRRRATAGFEQREAAPDLPLALRVVADLADDTTAQVRLLVDTPDGEVVVDGGTLRFRGGQADGPVVLRYPFETRVAGEYTYRARVEVAGAEVATSDAVSYRVRPIVWFS